MSDPVPCPSCGHELRYVLCRETKEHLWMCLGCTSFWSIDAIQKHLEETEHPLRDTVSG